MDTEIIEVIAEQLRNEYPEILLNHDPNHVYGVARRLYNVMRLEATEEEVDRAKTTIKMLNRIWNEN